jgi:hypothetical protein
MMMILRDFVARLLRGSTSVKETNNEILRQIKAGESTDKRHFTSQKTIKTATLAAPLAADIEGNRRICVKTLASAQGTSVGAVSNIFHKDLVLINRRATWGPKFMSQERA